MGGERGLHPARRPPEQKELRSAHYTFGHARPYYLLRMRNNMEFTDSMCDELTSALPAITASDRMWDAEAAESELCASLFAEDTERSFRDALQREASARASAITEPAISWPIAGCARWDLACDLVQDAKRLRKQAIDRTLAATSTLL